MKGSNETNQTVKEEITVDDFQRILSNFKEFVHHIAGLSIVIRRFLKKVEVRQVKWQTAVGVKDAAITAMAAGSLWSLKGGLIGVGSQYMRLISRPSVHVIPVFNQTMLQTEFSCMIALRLGHAIVAGIKILYYWRGNKKAFILNRSRC